MNLCKYLLLMTLTCSWVAKDYSQVQKIVKLQTLSHDLKSDDEQEEEEENEELAA